VKVKDCIRELAGYVPRTADIRDFENSRNLEMNRFTTRSEGELTATEVRLSRAESACEIPHAGYQPGGSFLQIDPGGRSA
jgi:hypothetical protein